MTKHNTTTVQPPLTRAQLRAPSDFRCAWRKMSPKQRADCLRWLTDNESDLPVEGGTFESNVHDVLYGPDSPDFWTGDELDWIALLLKTKRS